MDKAKETAQTNPIFTLLGGPLVGILLYYFLTFLNIDLSIAQVSGLAAWMVFWWITEAVPMAVTALLPIIILPIMNISPIQEVVVGYSNPVIFLFMGGFMLALALQKHRLHERIALNILNITGTSGNGIILGFVIATAFLSMWVSNTATAVMMLPIAISVTNLLHNELMDQKQFQRFALSLMLSIAYAANIGGFITLIGTPPNVVMAGYLNNLINVDISFARWLYLGFPTGILLLSAVYILTTRVLFPNRLSAIAGSREMIQKKIHELGRLKKSEKYIIAIFLLTVMGWLFKKQINVLLGGNFLTDHITAMAGGLAMFIVPFELKSDTRILNWEDTRKLPWGILLLFGGGISLAASMQKVGIIDQIGLFVAEYGQINQLVLILLVSSIVLFMTELMSNVALVTIMIPVLIGVANGIGIDPLILVVPATIASSCAFMMPISTPPNAIVYASGYIRIRDMMRAGFLLNLIAVLLLTLATYFLVPLLLV
jgi:sodium-dependent dicarboxylate transporter 2/3/5